MRYFVHLAYSGTNYHGWQTQPNAVTVQEILEDRFTKLLKEEIQFVGAGRTDTGVHASFFMAHFDTQNQITNIQGFIIKVNSFLPYDIVVYSIFEVSSEFHSRFDAISRTYKYFINYQKAPFSYEFSWYLSIPLNLELLNQASKILFGYEDFTSFSKLHTDVANNICKIYQAEWIMTECQYIFTIKANRFLRNMVRAITGTIIDVGREKITLNDFRRIIESKNRQNASTSAPAKGLFLINIEYPTVQ